MERGLAFAPKREGQPQSKNPFHLRAGDGEEFLPRRVADAVRANALSRRCAFFGALSRWIVSSNPDHSAARINTILRPFQRTATVLPSSATPSKQTISFVSRFRMKLFSCSMPQLHTVYFTIVPDASDLQSSPGPRRGPTPSLRTSVTELLRPRQGRRRRNYYQVQRRVSPCPHLLLRPAPARPRPPAIRMELPAPTLRRPPRLLH